MFSVCKFESFQIHHVGVSFVSLAPTYFGLDNFSKIFDSHSKPKFEITSQNQHILDAFKLKGWIYEYVEDESRPGYYKIRRRVPKKIENV